MNQQTIAMATIQANVGQAAGSGGLNGPRGRGGRTALGRRAQVTQTVGEVIAPPVRRDTATAPIAVGPVPKIVTVTGVSARTVVSMPIVARGMTVASIGMTVASIGIGMTAVNTGIAVSGRSAVLGVVNARAVVGKAVVGGALGPRKAETAAGVSPTAPQEVSASSRGESGANGARAATFGVTIGEMTGVTTEDGSGVTTVT